MVLAERETPILPGRRAGRLQPSLGRL